MDLTTKACLVIFVGLFMASIVLQFIRARKRQRLVRIVDPTLFAIDDQHSWQALDTELISAFGDFRKLQIVKRNSEKLPASFLEKLDHYQRISRVEMTVTAAMLFFAVFAYKICR